MGSKPDNLNQSPYFLPETCMRVVLLFLTACLGGLTVDARTLLVYAGAASKPPTEELAVLFENKTGIRVDVVFGGSGYVLSQMKLAQRGDLYFPGSSDYMEIAKNNRDVFPETERILVYLVPSINVQKGNPQNIHTLEDLARPGLRVAIANPEGVCVGMYAVEILENYLAPQLLGQFRKNLVNYAESCEKVATTISLKMADAVLGWGIFEHWDPKRIETIPLPASQIPRIGYIPIAVSRYTENREAAESFITFLTGTEGQEVFAKHHYFATPKDAIAWIGEEKPVGGLYEVPGIWLQAPQ